MDRIEKGNEVEAATPMEIEPTDTDKGSLPKEEATYAQYGVDHAMCCKCGAWIEAKNADDAISISITLRGLKSMGHPAECSLFDMKCKVFTVNEYERETDDAAHHIHHTSEYPASRVPLKLMVQALKASGIPSYIFQSKYPQHMSLVVQLDIIVRQKMRGFNRYKKKKANDDSARVDKNKSKDERILEAKKLANRMECEDKKGAFQALVCIVCDHHIIGTEKICHLTKEQLLKNEHRLGVESYNEFYMKNGYKELHPELVKQYEVDGMTGLLLSQRSRCETGGYVACQSCHGSITTHSSNKSPPKYAIANGFVIGYIPKVLVLRNKDGTTREVTLEDGDITDILRAMLAPTRAYGYTFSYFAGAQQSIQGHYMFYEVDQTYMGSVINNIQSTGANPHIHIVLGGRYTPTQKKIIENKTEVDTTLYTDLMTWFIQESSHPGFESVTVPEECPKPTLVREETEKQNNVDDEVDAKIEEQFDGGTYYFSSANAPSSDTGVHDTRLKFTKSLLNRTPPTLLAYGGDYKSGRGLLLEDVLPTAFPFGLGGPAMPRRTGTSLEKCLAHYGRLSLNQFMRGDFCLITNHMLDRQLSYTSGKVKCRAYIDGVPLAEKISQLTVKDLEDVVSGTNTSNSATSQLLKSVSASCKAMGHTSEAAAYWRRIYFALSDRHGMNAFMLTVTPNDLHTFSVKVLAVPSEKHQLPSLDSSETECIADFEVRKKTRLDFPGACSLNFQSVMQIVLKVLLAWDPDTQTGSKEGIVGELDAWGMAAEEQARKTLHAHLLLWSRRLSKMREVLFDGDETERDRARADFCAHIDDVMSASYCDVSTEWVIEHTCKGVAKKGKVEDIFKECDRQVLRDARHKVLCHDINGNVMECEECGEKVSTQNIINLTLNEWHRNALRDKKTSASKDLTFPLSRERHDIVMYRTSYDEISAFYQDDQFWGDKDVRRILQISGDNEHFALHGPRCFKKGQECTSGSFPQAACESTCIHEDKILEGEDSEMLEWYLLDGSIRRTSPWMILPRRPLGCQYLNTHNVPISTIFNCNSNVIIGDASNTFYLTLYGSKSTQKEDSEKKERIMKKLIRRLKRLQMEREKNLIEDDEEDDQGDFVKGLSMMMSAMNASTSRDVVSSTMAHYLVAHGGSRFSSSHKPKHLLLKQLEDTLDGKEVNFTLRRTNKRKEDGTVVPWAESTSDDYIYRPEELKDVCAYELTELYEKKFYSLKDIDDKKQDRIISNTDSEKSERYRFHEDHPGHEFAYMERLKLPAVAVVSLQDGKLCLLKDLELDSDTPNQIAMEKRENYAKMALMMFYPFRELHDLVTKRYATDEGSYWTTFDRERIGYFNGEKTVFWKTGFEILQNIEDREMMMQSDKRVRARDPVLINTKLNEDEASRQKSKDDRTMIPDISQFCDYDESVYAESDAEDEGVGCDKRWSHDVLVGKAKNITNDRLISARVVSDESIFQSTDSSPVPVQDEDVGENAEPSTSDEDWFKNKSYPTLLKLVGGTLVGPTNFNDVYEDDMMEDITPSDSDSIHIVTQDDMPHAHFPSQEDTTTEEVNIPTLVGVARKIAQQDKMKLDEKQYIAYEIIACTFLLELVEEGRDKSSILGQYLGSALGSTKAKEDMELLVEHLKARGGMSQLLMFLTGPAGAGKSTAVKVAQRFCFEFCAAVSVMWHDETFYFTACSGSAAALFRGVTIHSAAFMNGRVTDKARKEWKNVRILMIDEISYLSDNDYKKLDRKLKDLNGIPNKPFGGQSIIFSGDFRQFEAILAKYLLYDRFGSRHWENSINCVIILENIHRFKDDPEYGKMLTRLWRDDLTQEDREMINTRVVGQNGVTLPPTFDGDVVYACATNKERNAIQAGIFRDHLLSTHPKVNSPELPPEHTIIIEAVVASSKSKKSSSSIGSFTRDRIIHTCGDADCVVNDSKYIDPALRLYVGAHCMCIVDNKRLKDKVPIGNGTLCRVVGIKLKDHAPSHRWQNWDGRKVWTVSAKHVEWVEFEYHPKSKRILELEEEVKEKEWDLKVLQESYDINHARKRARSTRRTRSYAIDETISDLHEQLQELKGLLRREQQSRRFKLDPQTSSPTVSYTDHDLSQYKTSAKCKMTQIPVVLADSITGHKLQGMTLPHVIVVSWGYFAKNWPYVVLSRSTTFEGLNLFQPIDMEKSFAPSRDLVEYLRRAENLQDHILHMRKTRMTELDM